MRDYYDILDMPLTATPEEIREHYKRLVRIYHPDQFSDPLDKAFVEEKLKQINVAFQGLCNTPLPDNIEVLPEFRPQPVVDPANIEIGPLPVRAKTICRFQVNNTGNRAQSMNFVYSTENGWFKVSKSRRIYADKPFPMEFELSIDTKGLTPGQQYEEWLMVDLDGSKACIPLILKIRARQWPGFVSFYFPKRGHSCSDKVSL